MISSPLARRIAAAALVVLFAASCSNDAAGPPPELDFSAIDAELTAYLDEEGLEGANLIVVHRDWGVMHERSFGSFTADRISLLASASKIISVGVIMRLHDEGVLDIDAPISEIVGDTWPGARSFTLAQMLSNSSGLLGLIDDPTYPPYICQYSEIGSLQGCSRTIYDADDADVIVPPDTEFRYGGAQWQLAGGVAEVASGRSWSELVAETYGETCGIEDLGYSNHFQRWFLEDESGELNLASLGYPMFANGSESDLPVTRNPNIEGGGYATASAYGEILLMHLRDGRCWNGERALRRSSVRRMQRDRILEAYGGEAVDPTTPGYGLGWFVSRDQEGYVADAGAYGAMPWIDDERGYATLILLEGQATQGGRARARLKPLLDALFDGV